MSDHFQRQINELSARIEDVSRRQASMIMSGKVAEIDGNKVRLELGPKDERTGKKFLSPWVQMQDMAGASASHFPVKVGDPLRLMNPNGEIGAQSLAIRDSHTEDHPNPAAENTDFVLAYGGGSITLKDGKLILSAGGTTIEMSGGKISTSGQLFNEGKDVGSTHKHGGVVPGGAETDVPV